MSRRHTHNFKIILFSNGIMLALLGVLMQIPALYDYFSNRTAQGNVEAFEICSLICLFFGSMLCLMNRDYEQHLDVRQSFILVTTVWITVPIAASLPLHFSKLDLSFTDAIFESISGITTTGATVLTNLDSVSRDILLWRSILQWVGGIGVIALGIVFLPFLKIGGMQLFQAESSNTSDKILPSTTSLIYSIVALYCVLTALCAFAYKSFGMNGFEALNHAMTTISTGGFSTHDTSLGYYADNAPVIWTCVLFMLLGGLPFVMYVHFCATGKLSKFRDEQVINFLKLTAFLVGFFTLWIWITQNISPVQALEYAALNIVSIITTTGFVSTDYTSWGVFAAILILYITYCGACTGSTSGGLKAFRLMVAFRQLHIQFSRLLYPSGVFQLKFNDRKVPPDIIRSVMVFLFVYVTGNVILTLLLTLTGLDFQTALSGAATSLANVGPGIGPVIGPAGTYAPLDDVAKWLLCIGMLLGRLELMTVLVLFNPRLWRSL